MSKIHNLYEYSHALKVIKELPSAIKLLEKQFRDLQPYQNYGPVHEILDKLYSVKFHLKAELEYYELVVQKKGNLRGNQDER